MASNCPWAVTLFSPWNLRSSRRPLRPSIHFVFKEFCPMRIRKAVFHVAGLCTRFLPATKASAKEMLPVVDKPLIQYAIEEARAAGIDQFCMVTGRGKTALVEHFDVAFELEHTLRERNKTEA